MIAVTVIVIAMTAVTVDNVVVMIANVKNSVVIVLIQLILTALKDVLAANVAHAALLGTSLQN